MRACAAQGAAPPLARYVEATPALGTRWLRRLAAAVTLALLAGCANLVPQTIGLRTGWPTGVPERIELTQVPFFPQDAFQCGPAALATVLTFGGIDVTPGGLVEQVWLPARGGSLQIEMLASARRHGFVAYRLAPSFADLLREVAAGHPVVVLQDVGLIATVWHYAVVIGFDYPSGTVYLRSGTSQRLAVPFTAFERSWMKGGYWSFVALPPHQLAATAQEPRWIEAVVATARASGRDLAPAWAASLANWPHSLPAAIGLANEHHRHGDFERAGAVLERARTRHPESAVVLNNLAQTLSDVGRHDAALKLLAEAELTEDGRYRDEVVATRELVLKRLQASRSSPANEPVAARRKRLR